MAAAFDGPAAVSLRRAVPLDEPLDLRTSENGSLCGFAGNELVAEVVAAPPLAPWSGRAVSLTEARAARDRFDAPSDGTFDHCFVCGRARPDGFGIFSGPLGDGGRAATSALGDDRRAEPDALGDRPHDERHKGWRRRRSSIRVARCSRTASACWSCRATPRFELPGLDG
ncbi:MAG TPA: hypothetical protein VH299_00410 [Solirubrobacterales bacterium]|nr:hypothetical protein [Solirubrobacterales bacterium]